MLFNLIHGGVLADRRTYIMSGVGVLSAIASYLVGDADLFALLQVIFTTCGIYMIRKTDNKNKGK